MRRFFYVASIWIGKFGVLRASANTKRQAVSAAHRISLPYREWAKVRVTVRKHPEPRTSQEAPAP
jgi:endo-1,4-beta-mannosidase